MNENTQRFFPQEPAKPAVGEIAGSIESSEPRLAENITVDKFKSIIEFISTKEQLLAYKKDFYERGTKVLRDPEKILFTEKTKKNKSLPTDPDFSGIDTTDMFLDPDGSIIENFFNTRENELTGHEANKIEAEIESGVESGEKTIILDVDHEGEVFVAGDASPEKNFENGVTDIATDIIDERKRNESIEPNVPETVVHSSELIEDNLRNVKSLKDLSIMLVASGGIESSSQGHFSGADLVFLVERVAKGEAYIEEITREKGLRETVWNLIKQEKGIEPKSLEHEEEIAKTNSSETPAPEPTLLEQVAPQVASIPTHPPAPENYGKNTIPLPPPEENKSVWGGMKKFFGFGRK